MLAFLKRPIVILIGAVLLFVLGALLVNAITGGAVAKALARLQGNRADAALESGRDAVNTVGDQGAAERASDDLTRSNEDEIRNAEGSDAVVADPAHAAGIRSLCRRAAKRPECLQLAPPL